MLPDSSTTTTSFLRNHNLKVGPKEHQSPKGECEANSFHTCAHVAVSLANVAHCALGVKLRAVVRTQEFSRPFFFFPFSLSEFVSPLELTTSHRNNHDGRRTDQLEQQQQQHPMASFTKNNQKKMATKGTIEIKKGTGKGNKGAHNRLMKVTMTLSGASFTLELVVSFDTTGSMYIYLDAIRKAGRALIKKLVAKARKYGAKLRIGVIAHGDYCDKATSYVIKYLPLLDMSDGGAVDKVLRFVAGVGQTGGGDAPEAYELALHTAWKKMNWGSNSRRIFMMIGDNLPHEVGYKYGDFTNMIDWRAQVEILKKKNIRTYAVQAGSGRSEITHFWQQVSSGSFSVDLHPQ